MTGKPTVAILGGSLTGNKGAASMLLAVADRIHETHPQSRIIGFSPYPIQDRKRPFQGEIVDFRPRDMLARVLPFAVLSLLTGRRWRPRKGIAGHLARADVAVDVSGVAFMDGRGVVVLVYNVLVVLLPWAFRVPVVKMAQAMGPFEQFSTRLAARLTLPRVKWIGLRGAETVHHVRELGLTNAEPAADVAFLLEADPRARRAAATVLPEEGTVTLVAPSAVLEEQCQENGIDYVGRLSRLVMGLIANGHEILIIAHSARFGASGGRTNDLPVCRQIAEASGAAFLDREVDARELRALIGRGRLLVTSRFHGMISGLATATPTFVIGWSHKYAEVLAEFEMERWSVDFRELTDADLLAEVLALDSASQEVRPILESHGQSVRQRAGRNLLPVIETLTPIN